MRFHGLMVIRDEQDILPQTIQHLLSWVDTLFVLDTGSTDGSRDILQSFAATDKRVVLWNQDPVVFSDAIRSLIFNRARDRFEQGDWVGRVDADEFYHLPPPRFVQERVSKGETAIHLQWYYFRLTKSESSAIVSGAVDVMQDRKRPIELRRRFYKISEYAEPRFFRYRRTMRWPETTSFPFNAGFVARERIPIRHYPHRDPLQMEARFRLRSEMMRQNAIAGGHWKLSDWHKDIINDDGTEQTDGEGLSATHSVVSGALHFWKPGTQLEEHRLYGHRPSFAKRVAQRIVHPALLPILDRTRADFDPSYKLKSLK